MHLTCQISVASARPVLCSYWVPPGSGDGGFTIVKAATKFPVCVVDQYKNLVAYTSALKSRIRPQKGLSLRLPQTRVGSCGAGLMLGGRYPGSDGITLEKHLRTLLHMIILQKHLHFHLATRRYSVQILSFASRRENSLWVREAVALMCASTSRIVSSALSPVEGMEMRNSFCPSNRSSSPPLPGHSTPSQCGFFPACRRSAFWETRPPYFHNLVLHFNCGSRHEPDVVLHLC